jgi:hypothetical protein
MYLLWYKAYMQFTFGYIGLRILVRHLKFNSMKFMLNLYFMQVRNTSKGWYTKIGEFSMDAYFLRI